MGEPAVDRVYGQELVVHVYAPLDGPLASRALDQVAAIWDAGRTRLDLTEPIPGLPHRRILPPRLGDSPLGPVAAAQSPGPDHERQVVLRRINGALALSIAQMMPPGAAVRTPTFGRRSDRTDDSGWKTFTARWEDVCRGGTDALLGETRVFLGSTVRGLTDRPLLGEKPRSRLPGSPGRTLGWWRRSTLSRNGFRVWDTQSAGDVSALRELVVIGPAGRDQALGAWVWSDGGSADLPPLARYLLHVTVLRFEGRLLDSRQQRPVTLTDRNDLQALRADLEELRRTVENAGRNLVAGRDAPLGADGELAGALLGQIDDHLEYNRIDLSRAALPHPDTEAGSAGDRRTVFVVHGRDSRLTTLFFDFLRALGLKPMHWEQMVAAAGDTSAHNSEIVAAAAFHAQAVLVLLSPDDEVRLHSDLTRSDDPPSAVASGMQARPNVYYELGQAKLVRPNSTVIVEVGSMRPVGDVAGMNTIRFDGTGRPIFRLVQRLTHAGCPVDSSALEDWIDNRFNDLEAYQRKA